MKRPYSGNEYTITELKNALETQQGHLLVMSLNLRVNNVTTPREAEKYFKGTLRRVSSVVGTILDVTAELQHRFDRINAERLAAGYPKLKESIQATAIVHYHPLIQAVYKKKLRTSKYAFARPLLKLERRIKASVLHSKKQKQLTVQSRWRYRA